jgi:DNA-binding NtrC family response regulator
LEVTFLRREDMKEMRGIAVVIDDDPDVLKKVENVMREQAEDVSLLTYLPDNLSVIPKRTDVFVVDFDMGETSGPEMVSKVRERCPDAWIVGWGVESKDPQATDQMLAFFDSGKGVNWIIDKYIQNVATIVKSALKAVTKEGIRTERRA